MPWPVASLLVVASTWRCCEVLRLVGGQLCFHDPVWQALIDEGWSLLDAPPPVQEGYICRSRTPRSSSVRFVHDDSSSLALSYIEGLQESGDQASPAVSLYMPSASGPAAAMAPFYYSPIGCFFWHEEELNGSNMTNSSSIAEEATCRYTSMQVRTDSLSGPLANG